jgi:hypothetical protein
VSFLTIAIANNTHKPHPKKFNTNFPDNSQNGQGGMMSGGMMSGGMMMGKSGQGYGDDDTTNSYGVSGVHIVS